ncbi:hypothetical protein BGZ76_011401 [Entomortierella beljakovae]|nr:hypothetical protein BGZ76_011401 [Entomortierella beljakovae]
MTNQSLDTITSNSIPKFESTLVIAFPDVILAGPKILLSSRSASSLGKAIPEWSNYLTRQSLADTSTKKSTTKPSEIIYTATKVNNQDLGLLAIPATPPTTEQASNLCHAIVSHAQASNTKKIILLAASNIAIKDQKVHAVYLHGDRALDFPALPKDVPLGDHILSTFMALLEFIDIPTIVLIHPAKKGINLRETQAILENLTASLGQVVGDNTSDEFSSSRAFDYRILKAEDEESPESMMYL